MGCLCLYAIPILLYIPQGFAIIRLFHRLGSLSKESIRSASITIILNVIVLELFMCGRFWVYFIIKFEPVRFEVNNSEFLDLPFRDICSLVFYAMESLGVTGIIYVIFKNHAEDYKENHTNKSTIVPTGGPSNKDKYTELNEEYAQLSA